MWLGLAGAAVVLFVIGLSRSLAAPLPSCATPTAACVAANLTLEDAHLALRLGWPAWLVYAAPIVLNALARLAPAAVGTLLFWRRSDDRMAWLLSLLLVLNLVEGGIAEMGALTVLSVVLYGLGWLPAFPLPFLFPDGRHQPRWTRWIVAPLTVALTGAVVLTPQSWLTGLLLAAWAVLSVYAMAYRYQRVSTATERQQTKWVLIGLLIGLVTALNWGVVGLLFPPSQPAPERLAYVASAGLTYIVGYWALAICTGIAILRYRLWSIDVLIRRTLVYGALTGVLALVYLGSVVLLQGLVRTLTGQQSDLAIVASTLGIAALFVPLRGRLQAGIDQLFYRRRYDAAQTLRAYTAGVRDQVDLDQLAAHLVAAVRETIQPAHVSLWLHRGVTGARSVAGPSAAPVPSASAASAHRAD